MTNAQKQPKLYSPEEYLALEEEAEYKSEYLAGQIYAMAGGSANHDRISSDINAILNVGLRSTPCESFSSDLRILVNESGLYTYSDTMVICGPIDFATNRNDTVTNPVVIVEVLSNSTKNYDRGEKFQLYRAIPSFRDYVLIHQDQVFIEYYHKEEHSRWVLREFNDINATLRLHAIDFDISLRDIYARVDWLSA